MKNDGNVLLFGGAGISSPLGFSTLINFEPFIMQYLPKVSERERAELEVLFKKIKKVIVSEGKKIDSEEILKKLTEYIDISHKFRKDEILHDEFANSINSKFNLSKFSHVISQAIFMVDNLTSDHYRNESHLTNDKFILNGFYEFIKILINYNDGLLDYFTTNYDVVPEAIHEKYSYFKKEIQIYTGIEKSDNRLNLKLLNINNKNRKGLYVHRLHGCVAWQLERGNIIYKNNKKYFLHETNNNLCALFPGRKYIYTDEPFIKLFDNFAISLTKAKCCIIVGASFRDEHIIEYLIKENNNRNSCLPIIIIDIIDKDKVLNRFINCVKRARSTSRFYYKNDMWKISIVKGSFIEKSTREQILFEIKNCNNIHIKCEDELLNGK